MKNNLQTKKLPLAILALALGGASSILSASNIKVLATPPSTYTNTLDLPVNIDLCLEQAKNAANIVFGSFEGPLTINGNQVLFGRTAASISTMVCASDGQSSTFMMTSNGSHLYDFSNDAKSVRDRMVQIMSN